MPIYQLGYWKSTSWLLVFIENQQITYAPVYIIPRIDKIFMGKVLNFQIFNNLPGWLEISSLFLGHMVCQQCKLAKILM